MKDDDLVVATHGRSFWVLDDITPIRQFTATTANEDAHLFQPAPAVRFRGPGFFLPAGNPVGENPPSGVVIDYLLKEAPKDKDKNPITLEILDAQGNVTGLPPRFDHRGRRLGTRNGVPGPVGRPPDRQIGDTIAIHVARS